MSSGKVMMDHCSIAFCQQTPWLINASIRENILVQSPYDEAWHKRVIWSCVLDEDIEQLPDRDDTHVGSQGVSLSGGQQQRLALARAVYARAPSVTLDDTLSAIDARTEELVFDRLLPKDGLFRRSSTTVILVTHLVQHLQSADNIVVLNSTGHIEQRGSFAELVTQDGAVQSLSVKQPPNASKTADQNVESASDVFPSGKARAETAPSSPRADAKTSLRRSKPISDSAVLVHYLKSIGWYRASIFLTTKPGVCGLHQLHLNPGPVVDGIKESSEWIFRAFPRLWKVCRLSARWAGRGNLNGAIRNGWTPRSAQSTSCTASSAG